MAVSVIDALTYGLKRTGRVCFQPFDITKWFVLGFCAWLAQLGEGGFQFSSNLCGGDSGKALAREARHLMDELGPFLLAAGILGGLLVIALGVAVVWLKSRGEFMFLDGVVRNRGAVVEPWHTYRARAGSVFWFRIVLGLLGLAAMVLGGGVVFVVAWPAIEARVFLPFGLIAILLGVVFFLLFALVFGLAEALLSDFVVPIMYLRDLRVMDAWRVLRYELLPGRWGPFALFYLLAHVLGAAVGMLVMLLGLMTCGCACCLAWLPYLGTVLLLPVAVFMRSYALGFLAQLGPAWAPLAGDTPLPGQTPPPPQPQGELPRPLPPDEVV